MILEGKSEIFQKILILYYALNLLVSPHWSDTGRRKHDLDAILDWFVHNSYDVLLEGKISMRERHGLKAAQMDVNMDWFHNVSPGRR